MTLSSDLDDCLINFDSKILVTNLLDEYGGLLEETAKTVQEFLAAEEKKGKEFEKIFLLRGRELESENEVITLVANGMLVERKQQLRDAKIMLYSAEAVGGTKSPPTKFVPLREKAIKLQNLEVKDIPLMVGRPATNGNGIAPAKETENTSKKSSGTLGAMFKKQETKTSAKPTPAEVNTPKKTEPADKKPDKSGALGTMFKKQEVAATSKKSPKTEPEKKATPNSLGAMFKKQEAAKKTSPETKDKPTPKGGLTNFLTKKEDAQSKPKSPAPKKEKKEQPKIKEEPPSSNVSVNLFEESESSDDEEALDALKREVLTDDNDDIDMEPTTSNKRRRIVDSDDEDTGPEVKIEKTDRKDEQEGEVESEEPKKSETFMDDDGFIVTKKAKKQAPVKKPNPTPVKMKTPTKVKKESPKSPTPGKKAAASSKTTTAGAKTKQGNIMNFFTKK